MSAHRRSRCTNHCRKCSSCFSSTAAFDAHRKGPPHDRRCEEPADLATRDGRPVFAVKDLAGVCDLAGATRVGIVWTLARSLDGSSGRVERLKAA